MLNSEKKTSIVYAFLKVKTITCRHETFITNSGETLCEQVLLIQELEIYTYCQVRLLEKEMLRRRAKNKKLLIEHAECS